MYILFTFLLNRNVYSIYNKKYFNQSLYKYNNHL